MATVHVRVKPALMVTFPARLPSQNPAAWNGGVLYRLPSHHTIFRWNVLMLMIGRMIAPSARMMSLGSYNRQQLKKLRFSMTDNSPSRCRFPCCFQAAPRVGIDDPI